MTRGAVVVVAVLVAAATVVGIVAAATGVPYGDQNRVSFFIYDCAPLVLAPVGAALLLRLPGHWAGRTLIALGAVIAVDAFARGMLAHTWPGSDWAAWVDNWSWTLIFASLLLIFLKFAGTDRSTRWLRRAGWSGQLALAVVLVGAMLAPHNEAYPKQRLPFESGVSNDAVGALLLPMFLVAVLALACSATAVVLRRRRATGVERAQLRWLLWSFASVAGILVATELVEGALAVLHVDAPLLRQGVDVALQLSAFTIPVAIFVSVTRYELFEIDRVVSRTASYSLLVVLLTVVYAALVTWTTRLLPDRFGSFGVAATTLAVAAVFLPVRRRLVTLIDRRFNRSRVDAERVVAQFAERMRREDTVDPTGSDLLSAVGTVFQPTTATVWLVRS